jgi:hypothetical protein
VVLIDHLSPDAPLVVRPPDPGVDERAARRTLRRQITRLERELGETIAAAFPHVAEPVAVHAHGVRGPRVLGLAELEVVRDDLAERVARARTDVARRAELEAHSRALLEEMLRDPARHRRVRLPAADLGERSCGVYVVKPRLGLVGMLMGWWQVKVSSGCPPAAPA